MLFLKYDEVSIFKYGRPPEVTAWTAASSLGSSLSKKGLTRAETLINISSGEVFIYYGRSVIGKLSFYNEVYC